MLEELTAEIVKWQLEGDNIVLMRDANENVANENVAGDHMKETMKDIGLKEAIRGSMETHLHHL